jgi:hypothetical protein
VSAETALITTVRWALEADLVALRATGASVDECLVAGMNRVALTAGALSSRTWPVVPYPSRLAAPL